MDFRNTVLIMTSNIGSHHIVELSEESDRTQMESRVMEALKSHFKPEFLNRVDDVMIFHQLAREQIGHIAEIQLERVRKLLTDRRLELELTPRAMELVADRGYDPQYGARPLKRVIQRMVQDPLAIRILEGEFPEGSKIVADVDEASDGLSFRLS